MNWLYGKCWVIFYLWCRYSHLFSMDLILLDRIIYTESQSKKTKIPYCWEVLLCLVLFMNDFHSKWLSYMQMFPKSGFLLLVFLKLPSLLSENSAVNYFVKQISLRQMRVYFRPKHNGMGLDLKGHLQRWHWNSQTFLAKKKLNNTNRYTVKIVYIVSGCCSCYIYLYLIHMW
jgi:hypothetical protein